MLINSMNLVVDGIKLNDFLATMLQCKQIRLTKKMKNANLSTKAFKRTAGYIVNQNDSRNVFGLEKAFYHSIIYHQERAEIRFHMQKQWREFFSRFCVSHGQLLDAFGDYSQKFSFDVGFGLPGRFYQTGIPTWE